MRISLPNIIAEINSKESRLSSELSLIVEEAYQMTIFLQDLLLSVKDYVISNGFKNNEEEIDFFRNIKPYILGKLIYYNKLFRIETVCPVNEGEIYHKYFSKHLEKLKIDYSEHICNSDFYRYYRSGRVDRDDLYFRLGNVNCYDGLNSIAFEIDLQFSTYYDYKIAKIISNDLLYSYLINKIAPDDNTGIKLDHIDSIKELTWTNSKNPLIELIYAIHASGTICHGKIGIRKLGLICQILFKIPLNDVHHAFHRMKTRSGSRTTFLDQLKISLEEYMDKDL